MSCRIRKAANALLKILEEPPANALLMLVADAPARLLPTIRSRCRRLILRPLTAAEVAAAVAAATDTDPQDGGLQKAAALSEGSVGRALMLLEGPALELREQVMALLERLPAVDPRALHALGEAIGGTEPQKLQAFVDTVNEWMAARSANGGNDAAPHAPSG